MLAVMALSSLAALFLVYFVMPALWLHLISVDDSLDPHEAGRTLVASRNPFRETGPPANMAKLILLRHKIQTNNRRRRSSSHSRQVPRTFNHNNNASRAKAPWMRIGKALGAKQYH
ncbi:hypothetical protein D9756_000775 [Leucocoprinus leucothites]|uniref:Uncharacterized protein n=1 Tax=Leucocoprinus leucothites TaxID=201217 RepID=A0A8H5LP58_9AGAR|nr:hypothetical protein D9756_000775 [Leucoagaricus leucothites]